MSKYTELITSYHKSKPKYRDTIDLITRTFTDLQNNLTAYPQKFDLDSAEGQQLDIVGEWVGISRQVDVPIVEFKKGRHERDTVSMNDDTYKMVLKAKIAANHWNGTMETLPAIYQMLSQNIGANIFVVDNFNMTMDVFIVGGHLPTILQSIISRGYLNVKPEGVRITNHIISADSGTLFGFDINNDYIAGFENGSWGVVLS